MMVENNSSVISRVADVLGKSKQRLSVFRAIYTGKKRVKTVNEIATITGLDRVRVLQEGKWLSANSVVKQKRIMGATAYEKEELISALKNKIIKLVQNPVSTTKLTKKQADQLNWPEAVVIRIPPKRIRARMISIDDIDTFSKVARFTSISNTPHIVSERRFKSGIAKIIGEKGVFSDWGGEPNDLYSTKIRILSRRLPVAFAFKGPGTKGLLTPKKMGKHGDQIQRLFGSPATVFIVQYWGLIHESIIRQMAEYAKAKAATEGTEIFYGIIDGADSNRIINAYPYAFKVHRIRIN